MKIGFVTGFRIGFSVACSVWLNFIRFNAKNNSNFTALAKNENIVDSKLVKVCPKVNGPHYSSGL